jgi:hypothetical protein
MADLAPIAPTPAAAPTGATAVAAAGASAAACVATPVVLAAMSTVTARPVLAGDPLRNRLTRDHQLAIEQQVQLVGDSTPRAVAYVVAALLSSHEARRDALRAKLVPLLGSEILDDVAAVQPQFDALAPIVRLPLIAALMPLVLQAEKSTRARLLAANRAFARLVEPGQVFELALTRVLAHRLAPPGAALALLPLDQCAHEAGLLLSLLAQQGSAPELAYKAGIQGLLPPQGRPVFTPSPLAADAVDASLARLAQLHPSGRRALGEALVRIVAEDQSLTAAEADLLRMASTVLDSPLPGLPLNTLYQELKSGRNDPAARPRTATSGTAPRT